MPETIVQPFDLKNGTARPSKLSSLVCHQDLTTTFTQDD
jgi:hypothetical protein